MNNYHRHPHFKTAARVKNRYTTTEKSLAITLALRGDATDILQSIKESLFKEYLLFIF